VVGHLRGKPADMQANVHFDNVVEEVLSELGSRVAAARTAGCGEVWADPGIGFGKHLDHNLRLLKHLARLRSCLGVPIMVGVSRKRFIADLLSSWEPQRVPKPFGSHPPPLPRSLRLASPDGPPPATRARAKRAGRAGWSSVPKPP